MKIEGGMCKIYKAYIKNKTNIVLIRIEMNNDFWPT